MDTMPGDSPLNGASVMPKRRGMMWYAIILIVLAGLAGYFAGKGSAPITEDPGTNRTGTEPEAGTEPAPAPLAGETGNEGTMPAKENTIEVSRQLPGNTAALDRLVLEREGWVAIHDFADGVPGRILGASRFSAGTHELERVNLVRQTEAGKSYAAMIHASNGDLEFQFRENEADAPLKGSDGVPIMARFTVGGE